MSGRADSRAPGRLPAESLPHGLEQAIQDQGFGQKPHRPDLDLRQGLQAGIPADEDGGQGGILGASALRQGIALAPSDPESN